jgi:hypothetical protein
MVQADLGRCGVGDGLRGEQRFVGTGDALESWCRAFSVDIPIVS